VKLGSRLKPGSHELDERPFYWRTLCDAKSAPTGWYQWTKSGLVYLGESILEEV